MTEKEKFVKLVEIESRMRAEGSRELRAYITQNVYEAMKIEESVLPDNLYYACVEFVDYQLKDFIHDDVEKPGWLK